MFQVRDLDKSQESGIFHEGTEVELQTSPIDTLFVKVQLYFEACSRNKNGEGRWT